jgi:hypothetical protein
MIVAGNSFPNILNKPRTSAVRECGISYFAFERGARGHIGWILAEEKA